MPNMFRSQTLFSNLSNYGCLHTMSDLSSPRMVSIDPLTVTAATGDDKIISAGTVLLRGNGAGTGLGRAFPGSYATAAAIATSTTITVRNASVYRAGDVLVKGAPGSTTALGTVASVDAFTDVITFTAAINTTIAIGDPVWANISTLAADLVGLCIVTINISNDCNDIAGYLSASVYRDRVQFWNSAIAALLPEIKLCP